MGCIGLFGNRKKIGDDYISCESESVKYSCHSVNTTI